MSDEVDFTEAKPIEAPAEKIVQFFQGEANPEFVGQAELEKLVAFYASMKETRRQVDEHMEKAGARIKELLDAEKMQEKKASHKVGTHTVLLTRRDGSVKINWDAWATDLIGPAETKKLREEAEMVKRGQLQSKYVTIGKDSISMEVF